MVDTRGGHNLEGVLPSKFPEEIILNCFSAKKLDKLMINESSFTTEESKTVKVTK